MNFSIITIVKNNVAMIADAVDSVSSQSGVEVEHLIVDSNSSDGTRELISEKKFSHLKVVSESDSGIYEALNKGLARATCDIVGVLHSDDLFAHHEVLKKVHDLFENGADIVYADLNYVHRNNLKKIFRHWKSGEFVKSQLNRGWMPPHPTFFFRRRLLEIKGKYNESYQIAADYDYMLRFLVDDNLRVSYLPEVITLMRTGGESNRNIRNILRKSFEDYNIMKNFFPSPFGTLICKNLRKIIQFRI